MTQESTPRTILTFALGAAVGAVAALLLAPKGGDELRNDISQAVNDELNHLNSKGRALKQKAQQLVELAQDQVQDATEAGENSYSRAKNA
jgi:gas vesicle protein